VFAHGLKKGVPAGVGVCIMNDGDSFDRIGMGEITAIPLACEIKMLAVGKINEAGVLAPEAGHINPYDFISDVFGEISKFLDLSDSKSLQDCEQWPPLAPAEQHYRFDEILSYSPHEIKFIWKRL
jgi:hypothetical protein